MENTKIIREVIGTRIEPYGFEYLKTDGPKTTHSGSFRTTL